MRLIIEIVISERLNIVIHCHRQTVYICIRFHPSFEISQSGITGIVTTLLGTAGTTIVGRTIVSNLLKAILGVGTVVGDDKWCNSGTVYNGIR